MSWFDLALPYSRGADEVPAMFERAEAAEALGARAVWVSDDWYGLDAFAALGAVGQRCRTPKLGVGVTNPFARHLVQTAAAALTADRLAGGSRVIVAIGRSARYGVEHLGMHFGNGNAALRDSVTLLKRLLRGEEVTAKTEHFQMTDHRMTWPIPDPPIPVYMGAIGPKTLELAGEVADGVLLAGFCTAEYCRFADEHLSRGAERAGRSRKEIDLVCPQSLFVGEVPDMMYSALGGTVGAMALLPGVAESIVTGFDLGEDTNAWARRYREAAGREKLFAKGNDLFGAFVEAGGAAVARDFFPDELLRRMFLFGSEEQVCEKLASLADAGVDHVSLMPIGPAAPALEQARALAEKAGLGARL